MKRLIFAFFIFVCTLFQSLQVDAMELELLRTSYAKAPIDKKVCKQLIDQLESLKKSPVQLGYLGACRAIWASHTFNPISKLSSFNRGKKEIESAIQADPNNVELRFIRLSIQKHSPSFLGYAKNIEADTKFIQANKNSIISVQLKKMIGDLI